MKPKTVRKPVKSTRPAAKTTRKANPTLKLLKMIVQALDAKKADDLRILDVSKQSTITDYLVLATGTSEPHLRALRITLEKALDERKVRILGMDTGMASGWMVVDAFEVMVHLFTPENRDKYRMELLWKDATDLPLKKFIDLVVSGS